jgi:hypothetical protein
MRRSEAVRRYGAEVVAAAPPPSVLTETEPTSPETGGPIVLTPAAKPRFPKVVEPHILDVYDRAYAALLLPGKPLSSVNAVKWKHWTHHLRRRKDTAALLDQASWIIPVGGEIPTHHREQRVEVAIVKFGGRRWDRANFVAACKELVDELVSRGLLKNDTETWLEDAYYQVPGGVVPRIEVLFLRPNLAKTA